MSEGHQKGQRMPKVVTIGGGTGHFTILSGLKHQPVSITAIVSMADDGGSTGVLRDEFGALPPGDLRQCLVALSDADDVMRELFAYRFAHGGLKGHTFGNLFISTLEAVAGNLDEALERTGDILKIRGRVLPVTLDDVHLVMELKNGKILRGEHSVDSYQLISRFGVAQVRLEPAAVLNEKAREAIYDADVIVVGPGDLYTSTMPNFLVNGMKDALGATQAKVVLVANLMNKHGQTDDFTITRYAEELEQALGARVFDAVLYNTSVPPQELVKRYVDEGEPVAQTGEHLEGVRYVGVDLLADELAIPKDGDVLQRTLIRHDSFKLAQAIMEYIVEVT